MTARTSSVRGATAASSRQAILDDANMRAAELLFDMSALQGAERSRFGYKRAAKAIVALPASVLLLVESGALGDVSLIGPASTRILTEFASAGRSPTVEKALDASPRRTAVLSQRALRERFLSHHAMEGALSLRLSPSIVSASRFRGDLQMHSTWSDGAERIEAMAEACLALGHSCMGITDHSHGLPVAGGISMEAARRQGEEIDRLNERYVGRLRIYKGIEANIRADGSLDLTPEERQAFEYVVAAPHALLRRGEDQTGRMLAAVRTPGVAILGHPRGRVFNVRAGVRADWSKVFAAAAERGVAIELDGNWHRQDLDWEFAARALDAGCLFALDSDAHAVEELGFTRFSIAHARLAGIPADQVINCWPDDRLAEWMRDRDRILKAPVPLRGLSP
jgi:histidinol phosphatase-like PHP family hydrolase